MTRSRQKQIVRSRSMSLGFMMGSFRGITSRNMPKYIYMKFHGIYNICLAAEFKKVNTLFMKVN